MLVIGNLITIQLFFKYGWVCMQIHAGYMLGNAILLDKLEVVYDKGKEVRQGVRGYKRNKKARCGVKKATER